MCILLTVRLIVWRCASICWNLLCSTMFLDRLLKSARSAFLFAVVVASGASAVLRLPLVRVRRVAFWSWPWCRRLSALNVALKLRSR